MLLDMAAEETFADMHLYGWSTQDGTPTPDAPVDIVSAAEDGESVDVVEYGTNLLCTENTYGNYINDDGTTTSNGAWVTTIDYYIVAPGQEYVYSEDTAESILRQFYAAFFDKDKIFIKKEGKTWNGNTPFSYNSPDNACYVKYGWSHQVSGAEVERIGQRVNIGSTAKPYETYKPIMSLTIPLTNGLRGIPVESGGNYTDPDGQQWVCDEVDLGRGKYVQRVKSVTYDGSEDEAWIYESGTNRCRIPVKDNPYSDALRHSVLCNRGIFQDNESREVGTAFLSRTSVYYYPPTDITSVETFKTWLQTHNLAVIYPVTPIETDLPADVISAYRALHTYKPVTTVTNNIAANMTAEYVADTKLYIDSKLGGNT